MYGADWKDFAKPKAGIEAGVRAGRRVARPFLFQALSENRRICRPARASGRAGMYPEVTDVPHHAREARKDRPKDTAGLCLRRTREQATQILMAGLYEAHDRARFEIIALDNGRNDAQRHARPLGNRLSTHGSISAPCPMKMRPPASARKRSTYWSISTAISASPAWAFLRGGRRPSRSIIWAFPPRLGAPYIDYILADKIVIPQSEQRFYDEKVVTLPGSYQVNDNKGRAIGRKPSRAEAGLPETGFVFCNFNSSYKLTPDTFAGWMRILKQVDGSVLWLLESQVLRAECAPRRASHGGDGARILFAPDLPPADHLARLDWPTCSWTACPTTPTPPPATRYGPAFRC